MTQSDQVLDPPEDGETPALTVDAVSKRYGEFRALTDVSVEVQTGNIHAFVGANGAGKSTLLGMVAGKTAVTSGTIRAFGEDVSHGSPKQSHEAGIAAIYQELTIVPHLSAADNVYLGQEHHRLGRLNRRSMRKSFTGLTASLDVAIPAGAAAGSLSVADQQLIEIMRALARHARLILLDEPTSSLAGPEREALFQLMRRLKADGVTMLLVSHDLDEVLAIADRVSVFRDGRHVATRDSSQWTKDDLVRSMLGAAVDALTHPPHEVDKPTLSPVFAVRDLRLAPSGEPISFEFRSGEIVGIAGLMGSGRSSIMGALGGLRRGASGVIVIGDRTLPVPQSPRQALRNGIVLVTEDRRTSGFVPAMSAAENFFIGNSSTVSQAGLMKKVLLKKRAKQLANLVQLPEHRLPRRIDELSGGNQQKVVLGRAISREPRMLLVDEPTRGIDVGAKAELLHVVRDLADNGVAVIMVSSELDELLEHSDRVLVLAGHRLVADINNSARNLAEQDVLELAFGVEIA